MEDEILAFVRKELSNRGKNAELNRESSILLSNLLDSLFLVDLIVFLEGKFPAKSERFSKATKADLDTVAKIMSYLNGVSH